MLVTYALLIAAVLALWASGGERTSPLRRYVWLELLAVSTAAAFATGVVEPFGLGWIAAVAGAAYAFARQAPASWKRGVLAGAIVILGAGLMSHQLPGFNNLRAISPMRFSPDALPYSLHLNFDKAVLGVVLLGFCQRRIAAAAEWRLMLRQAAPVALGTIGLLLLLSLALGYVRFDPKLPRETGLWLVANLLFTCVAEEAFFRGFVQAELARAWREVAGGRWLALLVAALLFGVAHFAGGPRYVALATVAGIGYGFAYQRTQRIEGGILTHFALNTLHFLGFTYPALATSV